MGVWAMAAIVLGGLLIGGYLLFSMLLAVLARVASHPERRVRPEADPPIYPWMEECLVWAEEHGFTWQGAYRSMGPSVAAWLHESEPTWCCANYVEHVFRGVEFRTELRGGRSLTTAATWTAIGEPKPAGTWVQAFPGTTLDRRWQLHREGIDYLHKSAHIDLAHDPKEFHALLADAMREHVEHIRSLPLWYLCWPYWYFIRRRHLLNKTVREQIESGLVA